MGARKPKARRELSERELALVAELRQIEADQHAVGEAERQAFREEWAAKVGATPTKPVHVSKFTGGLG